MTEYSLAEFNIGLLKQPVDHDDNIDFVNNIPRINEIAENSPGFIWRLVDDDGEGATGIQAFDDPKIIINLSVWDDIHSLHDFMFRSTHNEIFSRRREWFNKLDVTYVLWWIPKGLIPTLEEAKQRLDHLIQNGPSPYAFNFHKKFNVEEIVPKVSNLKD